MFSRTRPNKTTSSQQEEYHRKNSKMHGCHCHTESDRAKLLITLLHLISLTKNPLLSLFPSVFHHVRQFETLLSTLKHISSSSHTPLILSQLGNPNCILYLASKASVLARLVLPLVALNTPWGAASAGATGSLLDVRAISPRPARISLDVVKDLARST